MVQAGTNTTVTGNGTPGDPYIINAGVVAVQANDTNSVDHTLTGTGSPGDPYVLVSNVRRDPAADNQLVIGPNGLYVPPSVLDCDDVAACTDLQVTDTPSVNLGVSGAGTTASPWVVTADVIRDPEVSNLLVIGPNGLDVPCEAVQDCVGQGFGPGLIYDDALNQYRARISTDAGNTTIFGSDNGIYTPSSPVTLGCGLEFGTSGEIQANLATTFPALTRRNCNDVADAAGTSPLPGPDTAGMAVYCDSNGDLRTMPERGSEFAATAVNEAYTPAIAVPVGAGGTTPGAVLSTTLVNPSSQYCLCGYLQFANLFQASATIDTHLRVDYEVDLGIGLGFTPTTIGQWDQNGQNATIALNPRVPLIINICLDPGESKTIQFRTRYLRGINDAGGALTIGASAREIRFMGVSL